MANGKEALNGRGPAGSEVKEGNGQYPTTSIAHNHTIEINGISQERMAQLRAIKHLEQEIRSRYSNLLKMMFDGKIIFSYLVSLIMEKKNDPKFNKIELDELEKSVLEVLRIYDKPEHSSLSNLLQEAVISQENGFKFYSQQRLLNTRFLYEFLSYMYGEMISQTSHIANLVQQVNDFNYGARTVREDQISPDDVNLVVTKYSLFAEDLKMLRKALQQEKLL